MIAGLMSGYKQTEAGVIANDWKVARLGSLASFRTGPFGSALHKSDYVDGGIPVINPMQIVDGRIEPTAAMAITEGAARTLSDFRLQPGTIVIGRRGEMGRCAFVTEEQRGWLCGTGSMMIKPSVANDGRFLQRVLSSPAVIAAIESASVGSTMLNLNQATLANLAIPFPPTKREQETIAGALSDTDGLTESLEQLIAKKRHVKQGAMQELISGKRRLPGFHGEWERKLFGDVARPRKERIDPRTEGPQDFCIELEHIDPGSGRLLGSGSTGETSSLKSVFYPDDVLFGKLRAYLRKYWLADRRGVCSTEVWVLVASAEVDATFLLHVVTGSEFVEAASNAYGTHMPRSDWNLVKNYELAVPPLPEQTAIATILSDMDAELTALEAKLTKTRQIKQGMMRELLTGRIRLV